MTQITEMKVDTVVLVAVVVVVAVEVVEVEGVCIARIKKIGP